MIPFQDWSLGELESCDAAQGSTEGCWLEFSPLMSVSCILIVLCCSFLICKGNYKEKLMILFIHRDNSKGRTSHEEKVGYKMPVCSRDPEWLGVICGAQEPGGMGGACIRMDGLGLHHPVWTCCCWHTNHSFPLGDSWSLVGGVSGQGVQTIWILLLRCSSVFPVTEWSGCVNLLFWLLCNSWIVVIVEDENAW